MLIVVSLQLLLQTPGRAETTQVWDTTLAATFTALNPASLRLGDEKSNKAYTFIKTCDTKALGLKTTDTITSATLTFSVVPRVGKNPLLDAWTSGAPATLRVDMVRCRRLWLVAARSGTACHLVCYRTVLRWRRAGSRRRSAARQPQPPATSPRQRRTATP
jgi:hypothetical protein